MQRLVEKERKHARDPPRGDDGVILPSADMIGVSDSPEDSG